VMVAAGVLIIFAAAAVAFFTGVWVVPLGAFGVGVAVGCGGTLVGVGATQA